MSLLQQPVAIFIWNSVFLFQASFSVAVYFICSLENKIQQQNPWKSSAYLWQPSLFCVILNCHWIIDLPTVKWTWWNGCWKKTSTAFYPIRFMHISHFKVHAYAVGIFVSLHSNLLRSSSRCCTPSPVSDYSVYAIIWQTPNSKISVTAFRFLGSYFKTIPDSVTTKK